MVVAFGPVAQRLEQATHNRLVPGSNPGRPTNLGIERSEKRRLPRQRVSSKPCEEAAYRRLAWIKLHHELWPSGRKKILYSRADFVGFASVPSSKNPDNTNHAPFGRVFLPCLIQQGWKIQKGFLALSLRLDFAFRVRSKAARYKCSARASSRPLVTFLRMAAQ